MNFVDMFDVVSVASFFLACWLNQDLLYIYTYLAQYPYTRPPFQMNACVFYLFACQELNRNFPTDAGKSQKRMLTRLIILYNS
jgi:hypothetical protein